MVLCNPDYFIHATFSVRHKGGLLKKAHAKQCAVDVLQETKKLFRLSVAGYLVLDDRVEWLFSSPRGNKCSAISRFSKSALQRICGTNIQPQEIQHLWVCGVKKVMRRGTLELRQQLDGLHSEPVRLGLVERAADYRWSSFPARVDEGRFKPDWDRRDEEKRSYFAARYNTTLLRQNRPHD